ncbi:MAG: hypothetical protein Q8L78_02490 [Coxiellaceae bacterium]|nr:hypothetical protein [Coxiellaceae bacterium]
MRPNDIPSIPFSDLEKLEALLPGFQQDYFKLNSKRSAEKLFGHFTNIDEIIHLTQQHHDSLGRFEERSQKIITLKSQITISNAINNIIKKHPDAIILDEATLETLTPAVRGRSNLVDEGKIRRAFPAGVPNDVSLLNSEQEDLLHRHCAPYVKFCLGEISHLHRTIDEGTAHDIMPKARTAIVMMTRELAVIGTITDKEKQLAAVKKFTEENSVMNKTNPYIFSLREKAAMRCIQEALDSQENKIAAKKIVLVYGAGHAGNFELYCDELRVPKPVVRTIDTISESKIEDYSVVYCAETSSSATAKPVQTTGIFSTISNAVDYIGNAVTDYVSRVYADIQSMSDNSASARAAYESAKVQETFAAHRRAAGGTFNSRVFYSSKNAGLTQLAHYISSPNDFADHADQISQKTIDFIQGDSPDAAAFTKQTVSRYQFEFLDKMQRYSENSLECGFDRVTELMNKEHVPQDARSFYYQQVLSALPINQDLTVDQIKFSERHKELKEHYEALSKQVSSLQKDAKQHHEQFVTSIKKLTGAVNQNAADIAELKEGQQEIAAFLYDQKIKSDQLLKEQQKEKAFQQECDGYSKVGQLFGMAGDVFKEPGVKDAGTVIMAGVMTYQAYNGFATLTATAATEALAASAAVAAGETVAASTITVGSCAGPIAMACIAALMVISMLMKEEDAPKDDPKHQQLIQALQAIMSKLDEMHQEFRESFKHVIAEERETRRRMLLGFEYVIAQTKEIISHHLESRHAQENLAHQVEMQTSKIEAGFAGLQHTLIKTTLLSVLDPAYLSQLTLPEYTECKNSIRTFLTDTSCSAAANGYDAVRHCDDELMINPVMISRKLRHQTEFTDVSQNKLRDLLGLLAGLANYHVGSDAFIAQPELMANPRQWDLTLPSYQKLLTDANPKIPRDKNLHIKEIDAVLVRAKAIKNFLNGIMHSEPLFTKLVENYHRDLDLIVKLIQEHLHVQENKFYQQSCIPIATGERLMQLDETFDEASKNQVGSYFQESCERAPIHFQGKTQANDRRNLGIFNSDVLLTEDLNIQEAYPPSIRPGFCTFHNAAKVAWDELNKHYKSTIKPAIDEMRLTDTEKKLSLGLRLQKIAVERNVDMNITNLSTIGADINHKFQNALKFEEEDSLVFISGLSQYHDANGDHHPHTTTYTNLNIAAHFHRSEGTWAITTADKKELEALTKKAATRVHAQLKSYRDYAIAELLADVEFTKALQNLESSSLQIHAFSNLMGTRDFEKPLRAVWIKETLANIVNANSTESIDRLQSLLKNLMDKKTLGAADLKRHHDTINSMN